MANKQRRQQKAFISKLQDAEYSQAKSFIKTRSQNLDEEIENLRGKLNIPRSDHISPEASVRRKRVSDLESIKTVDRSISVKGTNTSNDVRRNGYRKDRSHSPKKYNDDGKKSSDLESFLERIRKSISMLLSFSHHKSNAVFLIGSDELKINASQLLKEVLI